MEQVTGFNIFDLPKAAPARPMSEYDWQSNLNANPSPVIGILTQPLDDAIRKNDPEGFKPYNSYIMAAYVKFIEAQGARVVPIINEETNSTTLEKLEHLDGVLYPGGGGLDYIYKGKFVFDQVKKFNDAGKFYPAWGTCLGMEFFTVYTAEAGWDVVENLPAFGVSLPLDFLVDPAQTRMFKGYSSANLFSKGNYTYNMHRHATPLANFQSDSGLSSFWDVTSTSSFNGSTWVSTIESKNYPIMATMFHPEKTSQLWIDSVKHPNGINHSWESI